MCSWIMKHEYLFCLYIFTKITIPSLMFRGFWRLNIIRSQKSIRDTKIWYCNAKNITIKMCLGPNPKHFRMWRIYCFTLVNLLTRLFSHHSSTRSFISFCTACTWKSFTLRSSNSLHLYLWIMLCTIQMRRTSFISKEKTDVKISVSREAE